MGLASAGPAGTGACETGPPPTPGAPPEFVSQSAAEVRQGAKSGCGISIKMNDLIQVVIGGAQPLARLGNALSGSLGNARVIDKTGLTELFNFVFEFAWDADAGEVGEVRVAPHEPVAPVTAPRASSVFSAMEEQLGLRLEPVRGAREFVAIDAIQRPSAN